MNSLSRHGRDKRLIVHTYVEKAKSAFYSSGHERRRLKTTEAFINASKKYMMAASFWIQRLKSVTMDNVQNIFNNIPETEISEPAIQFGYKMLELNRNRLLNIGDMLK